MTKTDIANAALAALGQGRISSLDEDSGTARIMKSMYDHVRKILLQEHDWDFAYRTEYLDETDRKVIGWDHLYLYPAKALHIAKITFNGLPAEYRVYNIDPHTKGIASNEENLIVDYIFDVEDPEVFSELFLETFIHRLAAEVAMPIIGNADMYNMQFQLYQALIQQAKTKSAQEHSIVLHPTSSYVDVR